MIAGSEAFQRSWSLALGAACLRWQTELMQRLLSARALALAVVALLLMSAMVWLGLWQLHAYDDHQRADAQAALRQQAVPLDTVFGPDAAFPSDGSGRPVEVSGTFLPADQIYVRDMTGAPARFAVVTPLLTANGSAVLVVRGAQDRLGAPAPAGSVTVRGILEPSPAGGSPVDAQRVTDALSVSSLVSAVTPDLYSGYVLQRSSTSGGGNELSPVTPALPDPSRWSGIRNLLYACQWWLFAAFVAFMWWRITARQPGGDPAAAEPVQADSDSLPTLG